MWVMLKAVLERGFSDVARKCNVLCPFFRCSRRAKIIRQRSRKKVVICSLTNDSCIGSKCNFAFCAKHALLPNGTCALSIKQKRTRDIEDEAALLDREYDELRDKLKRLGKDVDIFI